VAAAEYHKPHYFPAATIRCLGIKKAGKQQEKRLKALEHKAQGLTPIATVQAIGVSLRNVRSYWNQKIYI